MSILKEQREKLGLDVKTIAQRLGTTNIAVYQYEQGKRFPHATMMYDFQQAYEMSDELFMKYIKSIRKNNK